MLSMFSACGGIHTGSKLLVLTAYFPMLALGILGKVGLFVAPPLDNCLSGLMGSSIQEPSGALFACLIY